MPALATGRTSRMRWGISSQQPGGHCSTLRCSLLRCRWSWGTLRTRPSCLASIRSLPAISSGTFPESKENGSDGGNSVSSGNRNREGGKEVGKATLEVAKEAKTVAGVDEALKRGDVSALALSTAAKLCADPLVKSVEYSGIVKELARDGQLVQAALKECGLDVWLYQGAKDLDLWLDKAGLGKPVCALVETFDDLKRFEQDCLAWADHHHVLLTAKSRVRPRKTDHEKGILTKLLLVGNLADLVMKHQLGEELSVGLGEGRRRPDDCRHRRNE